MATYNKYGQWSLTGNEEHLLFKTAEKKSSGKGEVIERRKVDPNSEEAKAIFDKLAKAIVAGVPKQPTNEQMFGHLVVTEEQAAKAEQDWQNTISDSLKAARQPIDKLNKSKIDAEWGYGKSFNQLLKEQLSEKEIAERNMHVSGED